MRLGSEQRVILEMFGMLCGVLVAVGLVGIPAHFLYVWTNNVPLTFGVMVLGIFVEMFLVATWFDKKDAA